MTILIYTHIQLCLHRGFVLNFTYCLELITNKVLNFVIFCFNDRVDIPIARPTSILIFLSSWRPIPGLLHNSRGIRGFSSPVLQSLILHQFFCIILLLNLLLIWFSFNRFFSRSRIGRKINLATLIHLIYKIVICDVLLFVIIWAPNRICSNMSIWRSCV